MWFSCPSFLYFIMSEIKTKELRLGNLFIDRKGQICEVERIEKRFEECKIVSKYTALTHLPVEQIQITEEVLLNCGFKQLDKYTFVIHGIFIHKRKAGFIFNLGKKRIKVEFLNKLQNIIEDLTEKELTYSHKP